MQQQNRSNSKSNENLGKRDYKDYRKGQQSGTQSKNFGPQQNSVGIGHILPMEVLDKCVGRRLWILMKNEQEYYGTLTGFTDDTNSQLALILQDVKEYTFEGGNGGVRKLVGEKMDCILLNGSHICMMIPGDDTPKPKAVNE